MMVVITVATVIIASFSCTQPTEQSNSSINGTWSSIGSGWILHIKDSTDYALYDITAISCLSNRLAPLEELYDDITLKEDTLSWRKGVMTYQFTRIETLPELCQQTVSTTKANDPLYNFEVFAQTVSEHYAFMELNQIDWPQLYNRQKARLEQNPTNHELYLVLEETLEELNDNHAFLEASGEVYEALDSLSNLEVEEQTEGLQEYGDFQVAQMASEHHLENNMTRDSWLIQWGLMNDSIGYIQLKAMWLYADLEIPESLISAMGFVDAYVETFHAMYEGEYIEKEVKGVNAIMDRVMTDLALTQALVVDIRFNGGGQDAVNFEILKRFNPQRTLVVKTTLKHGQCNHYTWRGMTMPIPIQYMYLSRHKPVALLKLLLLVPCHFLT